jgi:hypothetical protein
LSATEREVWSQGKLNPDYISIEGDIWIVARNYPKKLVILLVNFTDLPLSQRWDEAHAYPARCEDTCIEMQMSQRPEQLFWDSPEQTERPLALNFEYLNGVLTFQIPQIKFIGLVVIYE